MPGNSPHYGRWPQHDFTSLKKLRPQSVTSRIQPGSDVIVCAEMDEQWGYVGAKSRQRWLFYAYDRLRKTVVAHVFGERTMATLGRLMSLLSPFDVVIWMTDGWPLYESRLKGKLDFYYDLGEKAQDDLANKPEHHRLWAQAMPSPVGDDGLYHHPLYFLFSVLPAKKASSTC